MIRVGWFVLLICIACAVSVGCRDDSKKTVGYEGVTVTANGPIYASTTKDGLASLETITDPGSHPHLIVLEPGTKVRVVALEILAVQVQVAETGNQVWLKWDNLK